MLKSYFTIAWRNIMRHKLFTAINVAGLALGIMACLVIYLITDFELSFDKFHPGKERIFRIVSDNYSTEFGEEHSSNIPDPAPFAIRREIAGLTSVAVFHNYRATKIETFWNEVYPNDPFNYTFFDEAIARLYTKERHMAQLINWAMIIAIGISCLGLFGLATLTARQRTKEIGIRKVLGAHIGQIVFILNKDLIKLVLLSVIVASPLAWYFMQQWLNGFTYRIAINGWIFVLAGIMALLIACCTVSYQSIKAAIANPVNSLRSD